MVLCTTDWLIQQIRHPHISFTSASITDFRAHEADTEAVTGFDDSAHRHPLVRSACSLSRRAAKQWERWDMEIRWCTNGSFRESEISERRLLRWKVWNLSPNTNWSSELLFSFSSDICVHSRWSRLVIISGYIFTTSFCSFLLVVLITQKDNSSTCNSRTLYFSHWSFSNKDVRGLTTSATTAFICCRCHSSNFPINVKFLKKLFDVEWM